MSTSENALPAETPADSLRDAFSQTHNAVQWLARMSRSFRSVNAGNDIVLNWDETRSAFVTEEFENGIQLELRLPDLTLQFLEGGKPVRHEFSMDGHSPAHVEAWILVELLHRGLDRERFSKDLPYEIPNLMVGDSIEYSPQFREDQLKQILLWIAAATSVMKTFVKKSTDKEAGNNPLRLRAKNFSLEVNIPLTGRAGAADAERSIQLGFCPLRQGVVDPHYFVVRSEPSNTAPQVIEVMKVSGKTPSDIGSKEVAERLAAMVANMQKGAAQ